MITIRPRGMTFSMILCRTSFGNMPSDGEPRTCYARVKNRLGVYLLGDDRMPLLCSAKGAILWFLIDADTGT